MVEVLTEESRAVGRFLWGDGPRLVGGIGGQKEDDVHRGVYSYSVIISWMEEGTSDEVLAMLAGARAGRAERHGDWRSASAWSAAADYR